MTRPFIRSSMLVALLATVLIALAPLSALAQRGGSGGGRTGGGGGTAGGRGSAGPGSPVRPSGPGGATAGVRTGPGGGPVAQGRVVVAGRYPYRYGYGYGYGYPYGWYRPWYGYGGWGWNFGWAFGWGYPYYYGHPYAYGYPFGYAYGYPYPYGGYGYSGPSLKLEVTPKTAEVFVAGYRAGIVDDFDGTFQKLELPPGEHELVLYLEGYRTMQQKLFLSGTSSQRLKHVMERLAPGESAGPRPTPSAEQVTEQQSLQLQEPHRTPGQQPPPPEPAQAPESFGMISIRTQPVDAEILVDGEAWDRSSGAARLVIQLAPGRHRVEVRKTGFASYSEEVLIRASATMTLNVSLLRGDGR
jgi:hypothetical protein